MSAPRETIEREVASEAQTLALARAIAGALAGGETVALRGELGAGKTRFVRGLAEGLGADPTLVSSPTFVLANEYEIAGAPPGRPARLVHVDAYRLGPDDDLSLIGWDTLFDDETVVAVEWPERLDADALEPGYAVEIEHAGATSRLIRVSGPPGWAERLGARLTP